MAEFNSKMGEPTMTEKNFEHKIIWDKSRKTLERLANALASDGWSGVSISQDHEGEWTMLMIR